MESQFAKLLAPALVDRATGATVAAVGDLIINNKKESSATDFLFFIFLLHYQ